MTSYCMLTTAFPAIILYRDSLYFYCPVELVPLRPTSMPPAVALSIHYFVPVFER